ncbi:glycosyltransferase family 2 protein [Algibacter amylolyticus]|uniref:Glycosyltransferase family 2 protein n=1 Tax=Algibacter amylolyticus TaxID=1608400 RepID=A0A5M7B2F0_9FLAO|nr:glycosyltransferase family 2 protein [Algibacter amylolyticus]KAA5822448.1 glycosyltransferase family 2 protein [Algibacter amylolyticus]MBB5269171.1 glycosyltransferase involved in cell wall biosynthesis [Algibacter amylolyticus]TSJ73598.1 glycosyltransferase family 2 protein [Algibacter amylolyticus]
MESALVSIIIPTYNRAHLIGATLNSILTQTYTKWECIIINDHSTDNTLLIVNQFINKDSRFSCYNLPDGYLEGGNGARNYGFKLSNGEYVNWFDDDDVMLKDFLQTKMNAFENSIKFVIGSHYITDENLNVLKTENLIEETSLFKDYLLWKLKFITNSVLFKKDFFINEKLFNETLTRGQETEFFTRIFYKIPKASYAIINKPLFLYRQHIKSKSSNNLNYIKSYKESQSFTAVEVLKKSIELKDLELTKSYYYYLTDAFFRSLEHNHLTNAKFVLNNLTRILKLKNKWLAIELKLLGNSLLFFSKGIYRIEKRWKSKQIKI